MQEMRPSRLELVSTLLPVVVFLLTLGSANAEDVPSPFEFRDDDRIVFLGDAFFEQAQEHGELETRLLSHDPSRRVVVRNLGWSGDTVFGIARARFGTPEEGFQKLIEDVKAEAPTVLLISYGMNESFAGENGLTRFVAGYEQLLDALEPTRARVVLLSPVAHEDLGPPLPSPEAHNVDLHHYTEAIRELARRRGYGFVDLQNTDSSGRTRPPTSPRTTDGIHLNALGYWYAGSALEAGLGWPDPVWRLSMNTRHGALESEGTTVSRFESLPQGVRFQVLDDRLPDLPIPAEASAGSVPVGRILKVADLEPGVYRLQIDGRIVARASAAELAEGVAIVDGPERDQVEQLRRAIVEKNRLVFHRWRPQNETYLYGFRKHEQGQNAAEVSEFDPLIASKDAEIARLRAPVAHTYELTRIAEENGR